MAWPTEQHDLDSRGKLELAILAEDQNESFDEDYHTGAELKRKIDSIADRFPDGPATILDIGGGNGRFLDGLLAAFPDAHGYLLDLSELLLSRNTSYHRKHLVHGSVENLPELFAGQIFDVITMNWVLHHLVGRTWRGSVANCAATLEMAARLLSPTGVIIVAENMLDDVLGGDLPSRLVYTITSIKSPALVHLVRRHFNTAGVGVCFHSQKAWEHLFECTRLKIEQRFFGKYWRADARRRLMLLLLSIKSQRHGHYFLS